MQVFLSKGGEEGARWDHWGLEGILRQSTGVDNFEHRRYSGR